MAGWAGTSGRLSRRFVFTQAGAQHPFFLSEIWTSALHIRGIFTSYITHRAKNRRCPTPPRLLELPSTQAQTGSNRPNSQPRPSSLHNGLYDTHRPPEVRTEQSPSVILSVRLVAETDCYMPSTWPSRLVAVDLLDVHEPTATIC